MTIIKRVKELYPIVKPYIKVVVVVIIIGIVIPLVLFCIEIINKLEKIETTKSYKDSIFHEILYARNMLDYTLTQRKINVRNRATFSLEHSGHISESFADNLKLKNELNGLYQALFSAQKSAEELMSLLSQNNSNQQTIQNRENDIKRAIKLADEVGPNITEFVGGSWLIPPANLSPGKRIKFYEEKTKIIYSVATDSEVEFRWHKKNE